MQIQAINNNVEFGKSKVRREQEAMIRAQENAILSLSDAEIQELAYDCAQIQTQDKKHRRISTGIVASIPFLYGIEKAFSSRGMTGKAMGKELAEGTPKGLMTKFFNSIGKNLKGPAARVAIGVAATAGLFGLFTIVDGTVFGFKKLGEKSQGARNFADQHPAFTTLGIFATAVAAMHYIPKGISALVSNVKPASVNKMTQKMTNFGKKFNDNSFIKSLTSGFENMVKKSPEALKTAGKYTIFFAPIVAIIGCILHAIDHNAKFTKAATQNYDEVKNLQMQILSNRCKNIEKANRAMAKKLQEV